MSQVTLPLPATPPTEPALAKFQAQLAISIVEFVEANLNPLIAVQMLSGSKLPAKQASEEPNKDLLLVVVDNQSFAYNPRTDAWCNAKPMSHARVFAAATLWKGKVVVAGGWTSNKPCSVVELYDPETNTWTSLPDMQKSRSNFVLATSNDTLLAVAGWDEVANPLVSVEEYDATKKQWTYAAPLNLGRFAHCGAVFKNRVIIASGLTNEHWSSAQKSAEIYDGVTHEWMRIAALNTARYAAAAAAVGNKVLVCGGRDQNGFCLKTVEVYDDNSEAWTLASGELSMQKAWIAATGMNDRIYVIGGWDKQGKLLDSVECFDSELNRSGSGSAKPLPQKARGAAALSLRVSTTAFDQLFKQSPLQF